MRFIGNNSFSPFFATFCDTYALQIFEKKSFILFAANLCLWETFLSRKEIFSVYASLHDFDGEVVYLSQLLEAMHYIDPCKDYTLDAGCVGWLDKPVYR